MKSTGRCRPTVICCLRSECKAPACGRLCNSVLLLIGNFCSSQRRAAPEYPGTTHVSCRTMPFTSRGLPRLRMGYGACRENTGCPGHRFGGPVTSRGCDKLRIKPSFLQKFRWYIKSMAIVDNVDKSVHKSEIKAFRAKTGVGNSGENPGNCG